MSSFQSALGFSGKLKAKKIKAPGPGLWWKIKNYTHPMFLWSLFGVMFVAPIARKFGILTMTSRLSAVLIRADGTMVNYAVLSYRLVTTAFVNFLTDQLQTESTLIGDFKYHDSGVGTTAAAIGDTDIETTDGESRATGCRREGPARNIYRSGRTITYTTTKAITEHGLFNASTGPTLMDRHVFTAITVQNTDSIQ